MIIYCSNIFLVLFISSIFLTVIGMILVALLNDDDKIYGGFLGFSGIGLLIITSISTFLKYYCTKDYNDTCDNYEKIKDLESL
jgi:hypothetical protein